MKAFFLSPDEAWQSTAADLPDEAPLNMPVQSFRSCPGKPLRPSTSPFGINDRRLILFTATAALASVSLAELVRVNLPDGISTTEGALLLLFVPLFAWIAFSFCSAVAGFTSLALKGGRNYLLSDRPRLPRQRTAVLMPIYNEDVDAVFRRLAAIAGSLEMEGVRDGFDIFVLSDTTDPAIAEAEQEAFIRLKAHSSVSVYYRRRPKNIERKPGNISEWVRRFGAAYGHMIILDADSLMSGWAMLQLADAMERHPGVGLIQSVPTIAGCGTLFARWQQFASRLYGPVATAGLLWWSGSEGTFWGHNAIVRVSAFAQCCGLPPLKGREPFGGHILSHDLVEAALLRRHGWAVHMVTMPEGSYEEYPPTLIDYAIRDRRWCQGNLQHIRLLNSRGMHWVSRLHLLMGASAYLTSPLWLLLLVASIAQSAQTGNAADSLWLPLAGVSAWLLLLTTAMLLGPKLMATAWTLASAERRASYGGTWKIIGGMLVDIPLAALIAPATMVTQIEALVSLVRGKPCGWSAQRRDVNRITLGEALGRYRTHLTIGGIIAVISALVPSLAFWMVPIVAGLVSAPFLVVLTSRRDLGDWTRRMGLFSTPEELSPSRVLLRGLPADIAMPGPGPQRPFAEPELTVVGRWDYQ